MNQLVAEARALCEGATEGPWETLLGAGTEYWIKTPRYGVRDFCCLTGGLEHEADAALIARSRTLLPEMAEEIERLQAALEKVLHDLDQLKVANDKYLADFEAGRLIRLPEFPQNIDDILEPLKVQSALNSEIMKLNFRKEHKPEAVSILDYTIIAAFYKVLAEAEALAAMKEDEHESHT